MSFVSLPVSVAGEGLTRFQRQWSQALEARFDRFEIPSTGTNFDMMNGHLADQKMRITGLGGAGLGKDVLVKLTKE
jgi:hypothetical protein